MMFGDNRKKLVDSKKMPVHPQQRVITMCITMFVSGNAGRFFLFLTFFFNQIMVYDLKNII